AEPPVIKFQSLLKIAPVLWIDFLPVEAGKEIQHFATGQIWVESHLTRQIANERSRQNSFRQAIVPEDESLPTGRSQQVEQDADGGRLAPAAQPEEAEALAWRHHYMSIT